jgi:phosphocarrier protein
MQKFEYTIQDAVGLHARPAGLLVKFAKQFKSEVKLEQNGKNASARALMSVIGLGAVCGTTVTVTVEGEDEKEAAEALKIFMKENM